MTEDEPFIVGIRAEPLDDLRRLVYADWLDEHDRPAEAEYLRLVAALAATGTAVDPAHPHAVRLLALVPELEPKWREAVGGRFDLWFDPPLDIAQKINFIKCVRQVSGMGLHEAKVFSESLPKVLSSTIPFEEAISQATLFAGTSVGHRVLPTTEPSSNQPYRGRVTLSWDAGYDEEQTDPRPSVADSQAALGHLRRILAADANSSPLAANIPQEASSDMDYYSVVLVTGLLVGEAERQAERWRAKLLGGGSLDGATADPPFSGFISISGG